MERLLKVGVIAGAHGVRGQVKIKSFMEIPADIARYGPVQDEAGRTFALTAKGMARGLVIAEIQGVQTREEAEGLRGTELYLSVSALPESEPDTYFRGELIGLCVADAQGRELGRVIAAHNFGAGDILEIAFANGTEEMLPFARKYFSEIDLEARKIIYKPPSA